MTSIDTSVESEALSGAVLGIIGAYGMGAVSEPGNLSVKQTLGAAAANQVRVPAEIVRHERVNERRAV